VLSTEPELKHVSVSACVLQTDNRAFATADDESDDDSPAPAAAARQAPVRPSAAAGRGAGRGGAAGGGGGGKGPKDAAARQAEFRAKKLVEEAEVGWVFVFGGEGGWVGEAGVGGWGGRHWGGGMVVY
jgi:hypothetical protein